MNVFEYTKNKDRCLLSAVCAKSGGNAKFLFLPRCNGSLKIGDKLLPIKRGEAELDARMLESGIYTPVFIDEDGRGHICDAVKIEAGSVFPCEISIDDVCRLNKKIAYAEDMLEKANEKLLRLENAVFGNTIF
jgi:hypothetical protein